MKDKKKKNRLNSPFLTDLEKKLKNDEKPGRKSPNNKFNNRFPLLFILGMIAIGLYVATRTSQNQVVEKIAYSDFIYSIKEGKVAKATVINHEKIHFEINGSIYETGIPYHDQNLMEILLKNDVQIEKKEVKDGLIKEILFAYLPWILILVVMYFLFFRQIRGRAGGAFNFGKSRAKLVNQENIKITFKDVEGCEEGKEELKEVVSFLKSPKKYIDIGAKIPKGVLLVGPPGTGKTLLAKAVAGEAKVPFFSMSGSDFVEMFVGVGASRVRDLFETGKKQSPCIIFIDEIDAVGRTRGAGYGGGHDEREQTLNQMLVEMDGFETKDTVIVIAATNRSDVLDKALLRPGRFDRQVVVDMPDVKGRKGILKVHSKKVKLAKNVDLSEIARGTPGFTGADLANLINEAAILSARANRKEILKKDLEEARDKIYMGAERRSMFIKPEEKKNTAYHEAGHALVGILTKNADRLHKVSIVPRGRALGLTWFFPEDGILSATKSKLEAELMVMFGGRAAEEIMFKDYTTGAANDIQRATKIARAMVTQYGMSNLGPINLGEDDQPVFLGRDLVSKESVSEETAKKIDMEISRILTDAYTKTKRLLKTNISKLKKFAEELLVKEIMDMDEIYDLLKIKKPVIEDLS